MAGWGELFRDGAGTGRRDRSWWGRSRQTNHREVSKTVNRSAPLCNLRTCLSGSEATDTCKLQTETTGQNLKPSDQRSVFLSHIKQGASISTDGPSSRRARWSEQPESPPCSETGEVLMLFPQAHTEAACNPAQDLLTAPATSQVRATGLLSELSVLKACAAKSTPFSKPLPLVSMTIFTWFSYL